MNICPHCKKEFPEGRSFGAHVTNCKLNPKRKEIQDKVNKTKKSKWKEFKVKCYKCGKEIIINEWNTNKPKKEKYFCSRSCANSRGPRTEDFKEKVRKKLIGRKYKKDRKEYFCKECNKKLSNKRKSRLCKSCLPKSTEYRKKISKANKGKTGGYRERGGRGKQGWFNGIFCNSSWELAYLIYNNDHNIKTIRNKKGFEYIFESEVYKFYPDFIVNKKFVEIKGYLDKKNKAKIKQFKKKLEVIDKNKIKPYLEYTIFKYGKDFIKLFKIKP